VVSGTGIGAEHLGEHTLTARHLDQATQTNRHPEQGTQIDSHPDQATQTDRHPEQATQIDRHPEQSTQIDRHPDWHSDGQTPTSARGGQSSSSKLDGDGRQGVGVWDGLLQTDARPGDCWPWGLIRV
jgi:hypothetical protein